MSFDDAVAFWNYRSVFGEVLQTPNLDRICGVSTAFQSAYCQAPVCSPSRASFMSGQAPHQSGATTSERRFYECFKPEEMWPARLKAEGYHCATGGKVMRGLQPLPPRIHQAIYSDMPRAFRRERRKRLAGGNLPESRMSFGGFRGGPAVIDPKDDHELYDDRVAVNAIRFLRRHDLHQPFYREVGLSAPHGPWITPRRFKEMYDPVGFVPPRAWETGFETAAQMDHESPVNFAGVTLHYWQNSLRNYFSSLSYADDQLGRVWDALQASEHAQETLVVILSDHGLHLGERDRFRKHSLLEQVANVPLIIHDPRRPVAQVVTDPVALLDVGPTVMDFLGLPEIPGCVGRSLRPYMDMLGDPGRAVPTFLGDSAAVRKGRYRYIRYADGATQMYDLAKDWWQTRPLSKDHPAYSGMAEAHLDCCRLHGFEYAPAARHVG